MPVTGGIRWDSASLNSRSPGACQTCSGAVRSAEPDLQRAFGSWDRRGPAGICRADFLAVFSFPPGWEFPEHPSPKAGETHSFFFLNLCGFPLAVARTPRFGNL